MDRRIFLLNMLNVYDVPLSSNSIKYQKYNQNHDIIKKLWVNRDLLLCVLPSNHLMYCHACLNDSKIKTKHIVAIYVRLKDKKDANV